MNIYSKPPYSKRYVSYLSDCLEPCFNNIPCCLVRRICMIVENGDVRHIILKELRTILKTQKYPQIVITKIKKIELRKFSQFLRNTLELKNWKATTIFCQVVPSVSFRYKSKGEKEAMEHFKHVLKICPNRRHDFQNKLRNTWTSLLKILTLLLLDILTFSM